MYFSGRSVYENIYQDSICRFFPKDPHIYKTILAFGILVLKGNLGSERGKFEGRSNWCDLAMLYVMLLRKPYSWTHLTSVADIFIVFFCTVVIFDLF